MVCSELEAPLVICGKFWGGALVAGCEGVALSHRWCGCGRCRGVSVVGVAVGCDVTWGGDGGARGGMHDGAAAVRFRRTLVAGGGFTRTAEDRVPL